MRHKKTNLCAAMGMVLAMLVMGCAKGQTVTDFICSPTSDQQATAAQMISALDTAQAAVSTFFPAVGIVKASAVLTNIKNGGCFLISELTDAFKAVDAGNAATASAQNKALATSASETLPQYEPLRKLLK